MAHIVSKVQSENENCNYSAQRIDFLQIVKTRKKERIIILL